MALQLRVYVPPHPLIQHWLAVVRDVNTPMPLFRTAVGELSHWLTYEAIREWLPVQSVEVQTPLATCPAEIIDPTQPVAIIPVLRAGLSMLEKCQSILSNASVYHLGFARDEETSNRSTSIYAAVVYTPFGGCRPRFQSVFKIWVL